MCFVTSNMLPLGRVVLINLQLHYIVYAVGNDNKWENMYLLKSMCFQVRLLNELRDIDSNDISNAIFTSIKFITSDKHNLIAFLFGIF